MTLVGDRRRCDGDKHPLGVVEGATENAATVQALIGNLVERGSIPLCRTSHHRRLEALSSNRAPSDATRPFNAPIHKARTSWTAAENRCRPGETHMRRAWEMDTPQGRDASSQLARRLEKDWRAFPLILKGSTRCSP